MEDIITIINNVDDIENNEPLIDELSTLKQKEIMYLINFSISKGNHKLLGILLTILLELGPSQSELLKLKNYLDHLNESEIEIEINDKKGQNTKDMHKHVNNINKHIDNVIDCLETFFDSYEKMHNWKKWTKRKS